MITRTRLSCAAGACWLAIAPLMLAQEPAPPTGQLSRLAWMSGYWVGEKRGTRMEECWLKPRGGVMIGMHRDVPAKGKAFFEYLRIEEREKGLVYLASPRGRQPTSFALESLEKNRVVFANPGHDFPQRIIYTLVEDGAVLKARIEGQVDGKLRASEWSWRKARLEHP